MVSKTVFGVVLLVVGLFVGVVGGIGLSSVVPTHAPDVHPSYRALQENALTHFHITSDFNAGEFSKIAVMTVAEAESEGYTKLSECIPQMGFHYAKMGPRGPSMPILMFDNSGKMIGLELESLSEQSTPPWEHLQEGHEGMEVEHWTYHEYFTHEPDKACGL